MLRDHASDVWSHLATYTHDFGVNGPTREVAAEE